PASFGAGVCFAPVPKIMLPGWALDRGLPFSRRFVFGQRIPMSVCFAYVVTPDRESAEQIARLLLAKDLVACANLLDGMTSIYRWEGEIRHDREVALILKTRMPLMPEV